MTQYEMFNKSLSCKEFSFTIENIEQTPLEMNGELLSGKLRFVWSENELYCTYVNNKRTENITFYNPIDARGLSWAVSYFSLQK